MTNRAGETSFIVENDLQKASSIQSTDHVMVGLNLCTQLQIETNIVNYWIKPAIKIKVWRVVRSQKIMTNKSKTFNLNV